tara:strand:- start:802 stop:2538 length:1737 start_codon:yes stop_codon:yes gene_type:complete
MSYQTNFDFITPLNLGEYKNNKELPLLSRETHKFNKRVRNKIDIDPLREIMIFHDYLFNLKGATYSNARSHIVNNFITWIKSKKKFNKETYILEQISKDDLNSYSSHLRIKNLNHQLIYFYGNVIKNFFYYCYTNELISRKSTFFIESDFKGDSVIQNESVGIIYKISNQIRFDPTHPLYDSLNAWDTDYIGQSSRPLDKRYPEGIENTHNKYLKESIEKFGLENFSIEEIQTGVILKDLNREEAKWVNLNDCIHPKGYNVATPSFDDWKPVSRNERWIRNLETGKVFSVDNLKTFCKNPHVYDAYLDKPKDFKLNYTQMSNCLTGYIAPGDRKKGITLPHKVSVHPYCPARYTTSDLDSFKNYRYKKNIIDFCETLKFPIKLIDVKLVEDLILQNKEEVVDLCIKKSFTLNQFRNLFEKDNFCHNNFVLACRFKDYYAWWRYNINGEEVLLKINHPEIGDIEFYWRDVNKLALKLNEHKVFKSLNLPRKKDIMHSTIGRSLRGIITGTNSTCYGIKFKCSENHFKLDIKRFLRNKYVEKVLNEGYNVFFPIHKYKKEEQLIIKKIFKLLECESYLRE